MTAHPPGLIPCSRYQQGRRLRASVIGAGACGGTIANRLCASGIFDEVVLADLVAGRAEGKALDINHAAVIENFRPALTGVTISICGRGYEAIAHSDVVVISIGYSRRPGMTRLDLLEANAEMVGTAAAAVRAYAPGAVVVVLTNPLDEMTAFVQAVSGLPASRVIGQAGVLDSARFRYLVATELGVPPGAVRALTLGPHSEDMVPLASTCLVYGRPLAELLSSDRIRALTDATKAGGTQLIDLLQTSSTSVAPSAAVLKMVHAVICDTEAALPVCTLLQDQYGLSGVYLGVLATVGSAGVSAVIEHDLDLLELEQLQAAAERTRPWQARMRALAMAVPGLAAQTPNLTEHHAAQWRPDGHSRGQQAKPRPAAEIPADEAGQHSSQTAADGARVCQRGVGGRVDHEGALSHLQPTDHLRAIQDRAGDGPRAAALMGLVDLERDDEAESRADWIDQQRSRVQADSQPERSDELVPGRRLDPPRPGRCSPTGMEQR